MYTLPARITARLFPLFLGLALVLTGCSVSPSTATKVVALSAAATPTAAATSTAVGARTNPTATPAASTRATALATPTADVITAVKAVIQRADDQQQQAFAAQDPTLMRDTATDDYYAELVQTNQDLADNGVSAIALTKLEWGMIAQSSSTSVEATAFETWRTTYTDGRSVQQDPERNVYTVVLQGGAWKVQADQHPDTTTVVDQTTPSGTSPLPQTQVDPGKSTNWSGYSATGGTFTAVSGSWTVPQVSATSGSGADATWVGIGGVTTHDLIQAGTQATVTGGRVRYSAWVEMLPRSAQAIPFVVDAGDDVNIAITQQADGRWLIAFQNQTTGKAYQVTETYTSTLSSAEWVEEAPSSGQREVPLDNFGTVQFGAATTVKDGQPIGIVQAGGTAITMIDRTGQTLAIPSALGADGASFTVQRAPTPSPTPTIPAPRRSSPTPTAKTP